MLFTSAGSVFLGVAGIYLVRPFNQNCIFFTWDLLISTSVSSLGFVMYNREQIKITNKTKNHIGNIHTLFSKL
jgi:hypothetical protein